MHLTVTCDIQGNVVAIVASPANSGVGFVQPEAGQRVIDIDAPDIEEERGDEHVHERLDDLVRNYLVEHEGTQERLVKKDS
jgi:hypothetical protein